MVKISSWTAAAFLVLTSACARLGGDPKEAEVRKAVALAARRLNDTKHNMVAGMSFASLSEQGGGALSYIAATLPDNAKFTCYVEAPARQSYCVTLRPGNAANVIIIEGYGQSADKPILVETATVGMPSPPKP